MLADPDGIAGPLERPATEYVYNAVGDLGSVTDPLGNVTLYVYDQRGRQVQVTDALGNSSITRYDAVGNVLTATEPLGRTTVTEYDRLGRVSKTILPASLGSGLMEAPETTFTYDAAGNLTSRTDPRGLTTWYVYDGLNRQTMVVDALGTQLDPDDPYPNPLPDHSVVIYYDAAGNVVVVTDQRGYTTEYEYDNLGRLAKETLPCVTVQTGSGSYDVSPVTYYGYDAAGNLRYVTDARGNAAEDDDHTTWYVYDALNRQTLVVDALGSEPDFDDPCPDPQPDHSALTIYDQQGNAWKVTDQLGNTTQYQYDYLGRLTRETLPEPGDGSHGAPITDFQYDAAGNLLLVTDPLGNRTWYQYDPLGRRTQVTDALATRAGDPDHTTITTYDAVGNVLAVTDAMGRTTSFEYDPLGRVSKEILPDPDGDDGPLAAPQTSYTYDLGGNLISVTDPRGYTTWYVYDELNRRTLEVDALGSQPDFDDPRPDDQPPHSVLTEYDAVGNVVRVTDQLGHQTHYVYDSLNRRIEEILPEVQVGPEPLHSAEPTTYFGYDEVGNLRYVTDPLGTGAADDAHTTWYVYDGLNRQTLVVDALGSRPDFDNPLPVEQPPHSVITTYDAVGNVLTVTDEEGRVTTYEYDNLGRRTAEISPVPGDGSGRPATRWVYDAAGNLRSVATGLDTSTNGLVGHWKLDETEGVTAADSAGNHPGTLQNMEPDDWVRGYLGGGLAFNDANDSVTTSLTVDQSQAYSTGATFAAWVLPTWIGGTGSRQVICTDDGEHQWSLVQQGATWAVFNGNELAVTTAKAKLNTWQHVAAVFDAAAGQVRFYLNGQEQVLSGLGFHADSSSVGLGFNPSSSSQYFVGRIDDARVYNRPLTAGEIGGLAGTTWYGYDPLGRQTYVVDALGSGAGDGQHATVTSYDAVGNVLCVTDPENNTTRYAYDRLGRLVAETDALGNSRQFAYDSAGNLIQTIDRNGRIVTYAYDALGRQVEENWFAPGADPQVDDPLRIIGMGYDDASRVTQLTETGSPQSPAGADYTYEYNAVGNVIHATMTPGDLASGTLVEFDYTYDAAGNLKTVIDTSAIVGLIGPGTREYYYDALHRLTKVVEWGSWRDNKQAQFEYYDDGQLEHIERYRSVDGQSTFVGSTDYVYDGTGRLSSLTHQDAASPEPNMLVGYTWEYDAAGRIIQMVTDHTDNQYDDTADYQHDNVDQLTMAAYAAAGEDDEDYGYDDNGNRTSGDYVTGRGNLLLDDSTYEYGYDAEGNRIWRREKLGGALTQYAWDHRNRLEKVTLRDGSGQVSKVVEYTYDAQGRRVRKTVNEGGDGSIEEFRYNAYAGDELSLEITDADGLAGGGANPTVSYRCLYGPAVDQILAVDKAGSAGDTLWALGDHQGTVRDVAWYDVQTSATTLVEHRRYDSFGNMSLPPGHDAVDFLFAYTGRPLDEDTGLYDYRARWYDSAVGRFLSEDPSGFDAEDTNLYRYCGNNPMLNTDPTGLCYSGFWSGGFSYTGVSSQYRLDVGVPELRLSDSYGRQLVRSGSVTGSTAGGGMATLGSMGTNALALEQSPQAARYYDAMFRATAAQEAAGRQQRASQYAAQQRGNTDLAEAAADSGDSWVWPWSEKASRNPLDTVKLWAGAVWEADKWVWKHGGDRLVYQAIPGGLMPAVEAAQIAYHEGTRGYQVAQNAREAGHGVAGTAYRVGGVVGGDLTGVTNLSYFWEEDDPATGQVYGYGERMVRGGLGGLQLGTISYVGARGATQLSGGFGNVYDQEWNIALWGEKGSFAGPSSTGSWVSSGRSGAEEWGLATREENASLAGSGSMVMPGRSANQELGRLFNRTQRHRYDYNELYIVQPEGGYKILDSYNPRAGDIVSRRFTQLSEIRQKSAIGYLNEIARKYRPGYVIADVPSSGELAGKTLHGQMILEVAIQAKPVPQAVLDAAAKRDILIRDVLQKVY